MYLPFQFVCDECEDNNEMKIPTTVICFFPY